MARVQVISHHHASSPSFHDHIPLKQALTPRIAAEFQ